MHVNRLPWRRWLGSAVRLGAVGCTVALLAATPFDWGKMARTATLLAAGLRQPQNAAQVLGDRLSQSDAAVDTLAPLHTPSADSTTPDTSEHSVGGASEQVPTDTVTPPKEDGSGGKIVLRKLDSGDVLPCGIATRNSSGRTVDVAAAMNTTLKPHFTATDKPQVLIVHTHTTEQYMQYDAGYYNAADRARTTDATRSVVAAGDALAKALAAQGIVAIHDKTVHDSPQYSGAYTRSAKTVQAYLDEYPSIQVVLDLHRDALSDGGAIVKPTVTVGGRQAAQMMIVVGTLSTDAMPNPHTAQNLALAAQWQKALTAQNDALMRPLSTVGSRYNQHLHAGYLLVEIGAEGNTVAEAEYSAQLLGKTLVELLK
ncbi:MAG: stage II sporulation protein P [Clostridia bacterium]|nr:stage II sporulation protein P [Clostridia bacterium]